MFDLSEPQGGILMYLVVISAISVLCLFLKGKYWLKNFNDKYQDIPIIIMFAGAYSVLWLYSMRSGGVEYFGMPKNESDLENSTQILYYLKMYNDQIVINSKVLNQVIYLTMLFIFVLVSTRGVRISEDGVKIQTK